MDLLARQAHIGPADWNGCLDASGPPLRPGMFGGSGLADEAFANAPPEFQEALRGMPVFFKPDGGFWTSTAAADGCSEWEGFARHIGRLPRRPMRFLYGVVGNPNLVQIACDEDILGLLGRPSGGRVRMAEAFEFWKTAPDRWDAVHVPVAHSHHGCLNPWDTESTVWFRPEQHLRLVETCPLPTRSPRRRG